MPGIYTGLYEDRAGREAIEFQSDGSTLRTTIRGTPFAGASFDDLAPVSINTGRGEIESDPSAFQAGDSARFFIFNAGALCDCRIDARIPVDLVSGVSRLAAELTMRLSLGAPAAHGGLDSEVLRFALAFTDSQEQLQVVSSGPVDSFEDGLLQIRAELAPEYQMRNCFTCGLSDYFPGGSGIFGELACFRNIPDLYERAGDDKRALLEIFDRNAGFVQETHVCSSYRPRKMGAGYRG